MTPVMIHRYRRGVFEETLYFKSRARAVRYLREQGCGVREENTCHLGNESVIFTAGLFSFEMEEDLIRNAERRQSNAGQL